MKVTVSWYSAQDFDQTKRFYSEVLGLKEVFGAPGWAEFAEKKGDVTIGLSANPHAGKEPGATVVLEVADIESERRRLEARGVKFEGKTEEVPGIVKLATFRDPSQNRLQLAQPLMAQR